MIMTMVGCQTQNNIDDEDETPIEETPEEKPIMYRVFDGNDELIFETNKIWNAIIEAGQVSKKSK